MADEETWLALPRTHPLARRQRVRLRDLADLPFVSFPRAESPVYFDRITQACQRGGLTLRVVQEAPNVPTILSLIAGGMGVAFTNSEARHRLPECVALIPVEDFSVPVSLEAVWLEANRSSALGAFVALMATVLRPESSFAPKQDVPGRTAAHA